MDVGQGFFVEKIGRASINLLPHLDMNVVQHYYFELKDTVGSKGRTFAEDGRFLEWTAV